VACKKGKWSSCCWCRDEDG